MSKGTLQNSIFVNLTKKDRQSDDPFLHQSNAENFAKSFLSPIVTNISSF